MTNPMITIHDSLTDQIVTREMNVDEMAVFNAQQAQALIDQTAAAAKAQAEADALVVVNAKLSALGLTASDLTALGVAMKSL